MVKSPDTAYLVALLRSHKAVVIQVSDTLHAFLKSKWLLTDFGFLLL